MKKIVKKSDRFDVPGDFAYCFSADCPCSADCLRFILGSKIPDCPTIGLCVFPRAYKDGQCPHFRRSEVIRFAWGLTPLFKDIYQKHSKELHQRIYSLLGSRAAYYRYNSGVQVLTPEQQEGILRIFEDMGYDRSKLQFGGYMESNDYTPLR